VPIVLKSGSLNLLEPPGPVQVCNGIALPLPFTLGLRDKGFSYINLERSRIGGVSIENLGPSIGSRH
jgi:hypothetical protein